MAEDYPRSIGQYEIVGRIGKGAMGQVFKAVQPSLNRVVAVKVLPPEMSKDPERIERFNREAQAVAMLNHPNVVHIIDKDQDGDLLFFVMEYVPGSSLDAVLRQRRLSLPETLKVFRGICRGLDAAHKQGITHRDLNPRNILVSEDLSTVKVADFGISRVQAISLLEGTLSTSALSLGTLHYMAPEQARDMTAVDQRSDIYSSGVVLYEMLTGRLPVGRFSLPSQLNSEVPPEIDPIVLKCLASNPEDRYPSVATLLTDVGRLEDHLRLGLVDELRGISRSTTKMFTRSTRSVVRNRGVQIALGTLLVLAIVGGGAYFVLRGRGEAPASPPAAETPALAAAEPAAPPQEAPAASAEQSESAAPVAEATAPPVAPAAPTPSAKPAAPTKAPAAKPESPPSRPAAPAVDPALQELQQARDQVAAHQSEAALDTLRSLIERHPTSPATVDAYLLTGEIQEGAHQPAKAIATYAALRSHFPKDPRTAEGSFRLGKLELASGDKDRETDGRQVLRDVGTDFARTPWGVKALAAAGTFELDKNMYQWDDQLATSVPAALVTLRQLVEAYPDRAEAEKAFWDLGDLYEKIKRFDLAAQTFSDLGSHFPQTRYDAWWRAAQLFDRRLDQNAKALDAYKRVPAGSPHADDARKRISKLSR
jgi:TolA-binding protein